MSSLLPLRSEPTTGDDEPRVVDLDGEEADEVFSALSSSTAREIVATLHEEPRTQSEISEALDTTVQNVRYHLDKLEDAGLVEVVDTWYSSRGNEMSVYAPADGALVVSPDERAASRIRTALSRLIGGVAVIGLASVLVQSLIGRLPFDGGDERGAGSAPLARSRDGSTESVGDASVAGGNNTSEVTIQSTPDNVTAQEPGTTTPEPTTVVDVATSADPGAVGAGLPPGLVFFLGGLSVLVVVVALAYWSGR